jgi:hypothetical protein
MARLVFVKRRASTGIDSWRALVARRVNVVAKRENADRRERICVAASSGAASQPLDDWNRLHGAAAAAEDSKWPKPIASLYRVRARRVKRQAADASDVEGRLGTQTPRQNKFLAV